MKSVVDRADRSAGPDACWPFRGSRRSGGYGRVSIGHGQSTGAHRVAYEQAHGPIRGGLQVLHRCDNPPCVNPNHLFLGTARDNHLDALAKGRGGGFRRLASEGNWRTVLREQGRTLRWLAIATGKSPRTVYAYSRGQLNPTPEWLALASRALGQEVGP